MSTYTTDRHEAAASTRHYTVHMSDRRRRRHIAADTPHDAATIALGGRRAATLREDAHARDGSQYVYESAVATGRTIGGATPVASVWVYVYPADRAVPTGR